MDDAPDRYGKLSFNAPLSEQRADALAAALAATNPRSVLDIGCGWAELLLRVVAATPGAHGRGVDSDAELIARGRANAARVGLAERVELVVADGSERSAPADLVLCVGADHAFGDQIDALRALRGLVVPGGRLFLGTGYWTQPPTPEQAGSFGATPNELRPLAGLVDLALEEGFRPLDIQTANEDEWNAFESGFLSDWEDWLHRNASSPRAAEIAAKADRHRAEWLRGYRGVLGFAYLTLGLPAR
jgi:SAM-dependent methyltransferase